MATAKEMRRLIGKTVVYRCDRNRNLISPWRGVVTAQIRSETEINGDWYDTKTITVLVVVDNNIKGI